MKSRRRSRNDLYSEEEQQFEKDNKLIEGEITKRKLEAEIKEKAE